MLVCIAIKRTNVTDFATLDEKAAYFGFAHRRLHRSRRLTTLQRELSLFLQLREKRVAGMFDLPNNSLLRFL